MTIRNQFDGSFLIKLMGFSLNVMTLLAIVLAIGLVVDDAIVMLETCIAMLKKGLVVFTPRLKAVAKFHIQLL